MSIISPCKGCVERVPGCHDKCKSYRQWKSQHDNEKKAEKESRRHEITKHSILGDYHMPRINGKKRK